MKNTVNQRPAPKPLTGVVDDGTREVPLLNKYGKLICKVYFRPADLSIFDRYKSLTADMANIVAPLANVNIYPNGTADTEEEWKVIKSVEADLKARLNQLFDMDEADDIFATRNPFSSVGGEFFCTRVITALGSIIEQALNEEMELSQSRIEKYLPDTEENNAGRTAADAHG